MSFIRMLIRGSSLPSSSDRPGVQSPWNAIELCRRSKFQQHRWFLSEFLFLLTSITLPIIFHGVQT